MATGIGSKNDWRISATHTLDGIEVKPGLRVWDYDLRRVEIVGTTGTPDPVWDGGGGYWWNTREIDTGKPGAMMNASRLWAWHPSTRERA